MSKLEKSVHKKRTGRPPGRTYRETIPVRLTEEALAKIDAWVERQEAKGEKFSRSEAVRWLIDIALSIYEPRPGRRSGRRSHD
jgi:hypothetical protein